MIRGAMTHWAPASLFLVAGSLARTDEVSPLDPDLQAGVKIMWDHSHPWSATAGTAHFFYSYWDRGEQLPSASRGRWLV